MNQPTNHQELLTVKEVADYLKTSQDWVQAHSSRKQPRLTCIRVGKLLRYWRSDIERFLEDVTDNGRIN